MSRLGAGLKTGDKEDNLEERCWDRERGIEGIVGNGFVGGRSIRFYVACAFMLRVWV
ncbi:hypothetical protein [Bartonella tribocorum]|uniref:hypothetical protein n=1 Tax=Bartonella tribocorum TaxID=85701 RepID=UPI0015D56A06|nr:hypothetical protein [Bartonella tribocorum]